MKRLMQFVCLILVLVTILTIPVAAEQITPWSSRFFSAFDAYLYYSSSTQFQVCFDVTGTGMMDEIGTSVIEVQKSVNGTNWETVTTYYKENNPNMIARNTGAHSGYVSHAKVSGYSYRAYVRFYAKDSSGTGVYGYYAY